MSPSSSSFSSLGRPVFPYLSRPKKQKSWSPNRDKSCLVRSIQQQIQGGEREREKVINGERETQQKTQKSPASAFRFKNNSFGVPPLPCPVSVPYKRSERARERFVVFLLLLHYPLLHTNRSSFVVVNGKCFFPLSPGKKTRPKTKRLDTSAPTATSTSIRFSSLSSTSCLMPFLFCLSTPSSASLSAAKKSRRRSWSRR